MGAEAGLFWGVWRGGRGLALSLPGDPTGTSAAPVLGWSIGACPALAVLRPWGAARTGTPRGGGGGDANSLGGPPGPCGALGPGALAALQGAPVTLCCGASGTGAGSPGGWQAGPATGKPAGPRLRAGGASSCCHQHPCARDRAAGSCSIPAGSCAGLGCANWGAVGCPVPPCPSRCWQGGPGHRPGLEPLRAPPTLTTAPSPRPPGDPRVGFIPHWGDQMWGLLLTISFLFNPPPHPELHFGNPFLPSFLPSLSRSPGRPGREQAGTARVRPHVASPRRWGGRRWRWGARRWSACPQPHLYWPPGGHGTPQSWQVRVPRVRTRGGRWGCPWLRCPSCRRESGRCRAGAGMLPEPGPAARGTGPCPITGATGQGAAGQGKGGAWRRMDEGQPILPKGWHLRGWVPAGWAPLVPRQWGPAAVCGRCGPLRHPQGGGGTW